jgi:hypothetical protein
MAEELGLPVTGLMGGGEATPPPAQDIARKIGS